MTIRDKMLEMKEMLEGAGWKILNEGEIFTVFDDEIEWDMLNERTLSKETLTFCLFDDLGRRTSKLSDIFYVKRNKDNGKLDFDKKNKSWKTDLKNFIYSTK